MAHSGVDDRSCTRPSHERVFSDQGVSVELKVLSPRSHRFVSNHRLDQSPGQLYEVSVQHAEVAF
jgi:hypothetical protein